MNDPAPELTTDAQGRPRGGFRAMASPWEVHVAGGTRDELRQATQIVAEEARRIERKYSRYRPDGVVAEVHHAKGRPVSVDPETARLLDYAATLWRASERRFDITTGVLRRAWTFDGSDRLPTQGAIDAILPLVGWGKVDWDGQTLCLRPGMEIDFGGIGKEYAVDRALALAQAVVDRPILVNGGGDLAASGPPAPGEPWRVGIDAGVLARAPSLQLFRGAVATSGDAHRYLIKDGVRYSHVLDPRNGWPVSGAPRSVTVLAASCSEAGSHATLALLHGATAEAYLRREGLEHWVQREPH